MSDSEDSPPMSQGELAREEGNYKWVGSETLYRVPFLYSYDDYAQPSLFGGDFMTEYLNASREKVSYDEYHRRCFFSHDFMTEYLNGWGGKFCYDNYGRSYFFIDDFMTEFLNAYWAKFRYDDYGRSSFFIVDFVMEYLNAFRANFRRCYGLDYAYLDGTYERYAIPKTGKVGFPMTTSPKGGIVMKIGFDTIHLRKYIRLPSACFNPSNAVEFPVASSSKGRIAIKISSYMKHAAGDGSIIYQSAVWDVLMLGRSITGVPVAANPANEVRVFIIDSGAAVHATGDIAVFSEVNMERTRRAIRVANGHALEIHGQGSVNFGTFTVRDVKYVPGLTKNVLSVSQLMKQDYMTEFRPNGCIIRDSRNQIVGHGRPNNGLFELDHDPVPA